MRDVFKGFLTAAVIGFAFSSAGAEWIPLSEEVYWKPYVGLGVRDWRRTLGGKLFDKDIGRYGYIEDWLVVYGLLGCAGGIALESEGELFGRLEARLPIRNSVKADLTNVGGPSDVELEPGGRGSVYAEGGYNATLITVSVFVETLAFSESPMDDKYGVYRQPESDATMVGAKLGLMF